MVGIKRHRHEQEVREQESESLTTANILMLLSHAAEHKEAPPQSPGAAVGRLFECKTCNRQFPTFQALGGHRASHKKPRAGAEAAEGEVLAEKPRVHECSVCGLEFTVGQALGGHMRRHRAATVAKTAAAAAVVAEVGEKKGGEGGRRVMWMDLNLTPMENDLVMRKMCGIGVDGIGDWYASSVICTLVLGARCSVLGHFSTARLFLHRSVFLYLLGYLCTARCFCTCSVILAPLGLIITAR